MAEASTAVKAGSSILAALTSRSDHSAWPDMHESLLALHAILSEWCDAAGTTSSAVKMEYYSRDPDHRKLSGERKRTARPVNQVAQIGAYVRDIDGLMEPDARLVDRWSKKNRRTAARRGLKTLLNVYAPDLRIDIQNATEERREILDARLRADASKVLKKMSDEELVKLDAQLERTYKDLLNVTDRLAEYIIRHFPLDPQGDAFRLGWSWGIPRGPAKS